MSLPKLPLDPFPYKRDSRSRRISHDLADGIYVYVQDLAGDVYVLPDEGHVHAKVLGHGAPALYAGDLQMVSGKIIDITNLSGTFQFDDPQALRSVADRLVQLNFAITEGAVRFFPMDGSTPYIIE